ncbi:NAD dependent epimerase/dehydratase, putative [Aspergillus oryzae 3.042]|uniref:NAD dependent epimerase/dehydratase, putative n=1 Tax=Aspergillus oryzae (strain 3.042) TaxID=1160506 RepID=I8IRB4_ASPO3|nr:NAD dependent epimerase/dehydratase, putative [Aspergillus oryzae 3.042]|eukprot:EIT81921.1 NAD dependent epimerase/dehydratase, putative [Aspergillus oryzae 3.042]
MLVLVAGVTGNLGSRMIDSFISRGHQVRGLGRNPSKLPSELRQKLENFVEVSSSVDVTGLEKACHGVDAVVCAYQGHPELVVEGQLLLLRAAERMGVKRFVANICL